MEADDPIMRTLSHHCVELRCFHVLSVVAGETSWPGRHRGRLHYAYIIWNIMHAAHCKREHVHMYVWLCGSNLSSK